MRLFVNRVSLTLPPQVELVSIETANSAPIVVELKDIQSLQQKDNSFIAMMTAGVLHITLPDNEGINFRSVPSPPFSAWAILRRALCEIRDRTLGIAARAGVILTGGSDRWYEAISSESEVKDLPALRRLRDDLR